MLHISDDEILARMLFKLVNNRCFNKGHMLEERILSIVAKSDKGGAKKVFKRALKERLILLYGPTKHGKAYRLNIDKFDYIAEFIKEHHKNPDSMKK